MRAGLLALAPLLNAGTHHAAKAKSVIWLFLNGGPSQVDTFDPKPGAGYDYCGPLKDPIATNVPGIQVGELFPRLAQLADKYCLLRSVGIGNESWEHGGGQYWLTGNPRLGILSLILLFVLGATFLWQVKVPRTQ